MNNKDVAALLALGLAAAATQAAPASGGTMSFSGIADGSSNTVLFSEQTRLVTCLDGVSGVGTGGIVDGSSNTIAFGEATTAPSCFQNVRVTGLLPAAAAVPEPATAVLLGLGLAALHARRRAARAR